MKRVLLLLACLPALAAAAERYPVTGLILSIDQPHRTFCGILFGNPRIHESHGDADPGTRAESARMA